MSKAETSLPKRAQRDSAEHGEWLRMYRQMVRIRLFEEQVNDLYKTARMPGLAHLYSGEEAVAVGVCEALRRDDYITSTHRGHGHCLAKGAAIDRMFAELLGKEPGYCRGKGGSMHIADQDTGNLGANAIVGGSAGIATGAAMSSSMRGSDQVAVCFFGDGALGQGLVYEVMNMASLWKLPVIYVIENNRYAMGTSVTRSSAETDFSQRGLSFRIPGIQVDGMDVRAVKAAGELATEWCRAGNGPIILEMQTYRYRGHSMSDPAKYRSKEEVQKMRSEHDPIEQVKARLAAKKWASEDDLKAIDKDVRDIVADAADFAQTDPEPDASELWTDITI